jgi:hypothetical protein
MNLVPLNFPIILDPRNWALVIFVIFIAGALVHFAAPALTNSAPANQGA